LKRGKPLQRKTPLKNAEWIKRMAKESSIPKKDIVDAPGGYKAVKPRAPLKKVSRSKREQYSVYYEKTAVFLADNPKCLICVSQGKKPNPTTEVHHVYLRTGRRLLLDERGWLPSCRACREHPHANAKQAEADGILAPAVHRNSWTALDQAAEAGTLPEMLYLTSVNKPKGE
jgi:hypothetical protein